MVTTNLFFDACPYRVGDIYITANNDDPSSVWLGTTWSRIKDKFLLCAGDSYVSGTTGGESSHTLTVDEMPSHNHPFGAGAHAGSSRGIQYCVPYFGDGTWFSYIDQPAESNGEWDFWGVYYRGGSQPHNNMPPYLAVNVWQRTA